MSETRRRRAETFRRIADASSIGLAFPIALLIGYFIGRTLDGWIGTAPWMTYVFSAFGVAAGFLNAFRVGLRVGDEEDRSGGGRRG
jgi:F0F1-type ATP synthase assembly protein I